MHLSEETLEIAGPRPGQQIRAVVIRPVGDGHCPGVVFYSDIFQLTESTLRTARRLASHGFVVCAPEIYPHGELAGVALPFDDDGRQRGQAAAAATPTASFDADRDAVLGYLSTRPDVGGGLKAIGFCIGGHLAFRAALDDRVSATACFYPTGLHENALGSDEAPTLQQAGSVTGSLMVVFGSNDPHVPSEARVRIFAELQRQGVEAEIHVYAAEHAFMRDVGPRHDPELADLAMAGAVAFLRRC